MKARFARMLLLICLMAGAADGLWADDTTSSNKPVKVIAPVLLPVKTEQGAGVLPVYVSGDWTKPMPGVTRALIVFHGKLRNADEYNASGLAAIKNAGDAGKGTLLITPQFLEQVDVDAFKLPPSVLRWAPEKWMGGENAMNAPLSSFDGVDAILQRLANRTLFPNLKDVVIAGHSGGGQVVQRYAVVGKGEGAITRYGIHVRYVVANPSSYVYFSPLRPVLDSKDSFQFAEPRKSCNGHYQNWKYGPLAPPLYVDAGSLQEVAGTAADQRGTPSPYEKAYVRRNVIYLLGTNDTDPNHPALDKTCSAEDEGAYRFFRGKAYFAYMEGRHPELKQETASQQLWFVQGVEHDGDKMFNSPCGIAALFGAGTCSARELNPRP